VPIIELSLIQLFKTEQILAENVYLSVCLCVHEHGNVLGRLKKLAQPQQQLSNNSSAIAAAAVWWCGGGKLQSCLFIYSFIHFYCCQRQLFQSY